ncbi:hypothetical protein KAFR_0C05970 [Kazachstania africana CBS 2517]|uniref:UNC-45/Cro1/She4 central domain-containing protein n=1 Tax=Kazachstania africana (strain ATCC 22294 / BCRC 22015 / CBS 2517 / CECT 1963 / NBRC 1671 / NRRL Y-8276) TaxID=1071382 RepID=H2AT88_KAZAF|nr:hypothetical protein KAFR_0C05970 [Kazachstania africana CBS 2517]CCF57588.1 hypothetical protein KAFR_0C05970 [Kazachstania africana CBS 2517]
MAATMDSLIDELVSQFNGSLSTTGDAPKYNEVLDYIFDSSHSIEESKKDMIEEIVTRSYQDHSESREHLHQLIKDDIPYSLEIFESLSSKSIHVLIGTFKDFDDISPLLSEIQARLHLKTDPNVHFLLGCIIQVLSKFSMEFKGVKFIVRELCLRMNETEIQSMGLIIFSQIEKLFHQEFNDYLSIFISSLVLEAEEEVGTDTMIKIANILIELYPAFTELCSSVLLGDDLNKLLEKHANENPNETFIKRLLVLLSVACIDENIRIHISEKYLPILEKTLKLKEYEVYSSLVLIKTWSFSKLKNITIHEMESILADSCIANRDIVDSEELSLSMEGLAYLSLKNFVKLYLRHHKFFVPTLIECIKNSKFKDQNLYGALVILANLTTPANTDSKEKSMKDLQFYSNLKDPKNEDNGDIKDDQNAINSFMLDSLLKSELISYLNSKAKDLSQGSRQQLIRLIYNITRNRAFLTTCIKHGSVTMLLEYLANKNEKERSIRILACRALARILVFTDPSIIFYRYSSLNSLPYLFEMLPNPNVDSTQAKDTLVNSEEWQTSDVLESLLALTNLASVPTSEGEEVSKAIASNTNYWAVIENLMLDESVPLQRSTLELISNLMSHPLTIASKFFNFENPHSVKNFNLLVKLLTLSDINSQRAVAAIFANIANAIPFVAKELLKQDELIKTAINVFTDQIDDADLRKRLLILFYALFELATSEKDPESYKDVQRIRSFDECLKLKEGLQFALEKKDTDSEFADLIPILQKKLEFELE